MFLLESIFIALSILSLSESIRVDYNTNHGPIIPPTSTLAPQPRPPYREPAPVWENQDDDIPNPNPYQYVLPPPSRPRPPTNNYAQSPLSIQTNFQQQNNPNYGQILSTRPNDIQSVPALSVQYVPNVGFKYHAVVPSSGKAQYFKDTTFYSKPHKLNGKYNPKLKKYKAYEKVKYSPFVYVVTPMTQQLPEIHQNQVFNKNIQIPFQKVQFASKYDALKYSEKQYKNSHIQSSR